MDPSFCHVLSNCMSVIRAGIHLQRGKCLCCLTLSAQSTVFVFKDIFALFSKFHEVVLFQAVATTARNQQGCDHGRHS